MLSINKTCCIITILFFQLTLFADSWADKNSINLVSQNLNRFFDDKHDGNDEKVLSPQHYQHRINQLTDKFQSVFDFADVIAFQEVENIGILEQVSQMINDRYNLKYKAILLEGNDRSGMDVGYLVKQSLKIKKVTSLFKNQRMADYPKYLFSRPPLVIEVCSNKCLTIVNLHLRSMRGLRSSKKTNYVAIKRKLQAETMAKWINRFQNSDREKPLLVLGDFNALTPSDNYVDVVGTIAGNPDRIKPKYVSRDLVENNLIDVTQSVKPSKRYSYIYKRKKQQLDYAFVSSNLKNKIKRVEFSWIDYKFSDHAALMLALNF